MRAKACHWSLSSRAHPDANQRRRLRRSRHPPAQSRLGKFLRREHARWPIELSIQSFGIPPRECAGPRARASGAHLDRWLGSLLLAAYVARITQRCN
jgi:hypothetical protein